MPHPAVPTNSVPMERHSRVTRFLEDPNFPQPLGTFTRSLPSNGASISQLAPIPSASRYLPTQSTPSNFAYSSAEGSIASSYPTSKAPSTSSKASKPTSTAPSTVPSMYPASMVSSLAGQLQNMNVRRAIELPCLETELVGCQIIFTSDDFEQWYRHSLSHFGRHKPPAHTMCIFCEDIFDSANPFESWRNRMEHIAEHFELDLFKLQHSRPDFNVVNYLWDKGRLSEDEYNHAIEGTERKSCDSMYPPGWKPKHIVEKEEREARRDNSVPVYEPRHHRHKDHATKSTQKKKTSSSKPKVVVKRGSTKAD